MSWVVVLVYGWVFGRKRQLNYTMQKHVEWYRKLMSSLLSWRWKMVSFLFFQLPVKNIMSLAFVLNCHLHAVTPFKLDIIVRWVDHRQNLSIAAILFITIGHRPIVFHDLIGLRCLFRPRLSCMVSHSIWILFTAYS